MEYRLLENLSHTLEMAIFLKDCKEPGRKKIRRDQKRLIRFYGDILGEQLLLTVLLEGDHNGLANWYRLAQFLHDKKYQKALDILPVLGLWPAGPFIDSCPALERFEGRKIQRGRRPRG
jgi:hypothetical protein